MNYQILFNTVVNGKSCVCICTEKDSNGDHYGFAITEAQARERVQALADVGIVATYEPIDDKHWVNNWLG